ncbi:HNH endonuclease [Prescottella equi]|uniref:HNH endonuclease n=1 Tax=Rhodococcus hoagii TaxID=43767 RepID=UPI0009BD0952|nr:HNH endonuclease [Prescottella equi]OQQ25913.1 HNH endonuclease [Prescottella equi]
MSLANLTAAAVEAAMAEYVSLGAEAFRSKYEFGKATAYLIHHEGKTYDSKAIAGAAHGYLPGRVPLRSDEFSGGENTVARTLRNLGFRVPPARSPKWTRDEVILACDLLVQNEWAYLTAEDERVIELSALLQRAPFHPMDERSATHRNANGVARKTVDLATHHPDYVGAPTKGGAIDEIVLQQFLENPAEMRAIAQALRETIQSADVDQLQSMPEGDEDETAKEGRLLQRRHYVRERDRKLRQRKIARFLQSHERVHCEVCGFDFELVYGERGSEYTEVHRIVPLHHSGSTTTKLTDLVLLCANCHRMIHRGTPWLTPDELRNLINPESGSEVAA